MKKTETPEVKQGEGQELGRRDVLKIGAMTGVGAAVAAAAGAALVAPTAAEAQTAPTCPAGQNAIEAWPTSPLILSPFTDPMPVPQAATPVDPATLSPNPLGYKTKRTQQMDSYGQVHQLVPGEGVVSTYPDPKVYHFKLQVAAHSFSSSAVRTLVPYVNTAGQTVPAGTVVSKLPDSTIYGFNGTFPGPMINAEYGKPNIVRFENELDKNPQNLDRGDFGSPEFGFLTHLHNGHTAAESDGNPHQRPEGYLPGQYFDAMYLNYPAGGDDREKMSFLWFHDHFEGHTGANVYKGMAGLYPVYDPVLDNGDETKGLRLPGIRVNNPDGTFNVKYDIPIALGDFRFDDGATPHQDFHNGCGETRPDQWGKTYFRHFPNHGFVGDVFTVNGKAYPVLNVFQRKYRLRFLPASISRCWELTIMKSAAGPKSSVSLGYKGEELQGQYRIPDGVQCMRMTQIAAGGGLLPKALTRDSIENWPAMRHEVIVDFTKYQDGTPTKPGDVVYLTNIMKMPDGRVPTNSTRLGLDKNWKIPVLKIVIGGPPPELDQSQIPAATKVLRPGQGVPTGAAFNALPKRTFTLQRGGFGGETQWLINGFPFDPAVPLATVKQGQPEVWTIQNGGGGWVHPMHFHMEEHTVLTRNGKTATTVAGHADDGAKDDVIALDPSEQVVIYRNFRTFKGKYVAHCHNLAHEDHAMMFGWVLS